MGRRKHKEHVVKVRIPETEYRRYLLNYEDNPRKILLDLRCIRTENWKKVNYGARRKIKWQTPHQVENLIDEYFKSCYGVVYSEKTGKIVLKEDGNPLLIQNRPFTVSGLALALHIPTQTLRGATEKDLDALGYPTDEDYEGPTYAELINEARHRVEIYAEERMYDKDGFGGGKFVLDCAFGWQGRKEKAETKALKEQTKLKKKEFRLKKELLAGTDDDSAIQINVVRAEKKG